MGACLNEPFRKAWQSLNFNKEYLFGFETLIFAALQILYMHKQLVTALINVIIAFKNTENDQKRIKRS